MWVPATPCYVPEYFNLRVKFVSSCTDYDSLICTQHAGISSSSQHDVIVIFMFPLVVGSRHTLQTSYLPSCVFLAGLSSKAVLSIYAFLMLFY